MRSRPFVGLRIESAFNRRLAGHFRRQGWVETINAYTGYGNSEQLRLLARVVLAPAPPQSDLMRVADGFLTRRGWRNFASVALSRTTVEVRVADSVIEVQTDLGGYIDVRVKNPGLEPGWHDVQMRTRDSRPTQAPVQVISPQTTFGIISDIDDTVISTWLPRPLIAAWNSFMLTEQARQSVPGMARLYQRLLREHPGAPIIYVSTGAWNTFSFLNRFLRRHGYPKGAMLLTDWGPTNTGWFRSGPEHKRRAMRELSRDFPNIRWLLVGDDGQHDPSLYREMAELQPSSVRAIAIRQLTMAQQVLAHGTTAVLGDPDKVAVDAAGAVEVRAADGDDMAPRLLEALDHHQ